MINLKRLFSKYTGCLASSAKLKDALLREYPTEKLNVNILVIIYDLGIASKIRTSTVIDKRDIKNMSNLVMDEYGIEYDYIVGNIKTWADAFSVSIVDRKDNLQITKNEINLASDNLVSENIKDYVVESLKSGDYMIIKYVGIGHNSIKIPDNYNGKAITRIGARAFKKCTEIEEIIVPRGISVIGCSAFSGCTSLKRISLPEGLQMLGDDSKFEGEGVFENTAITDIMLPKSLNYMTNKPFSCCKKLLSVSIPDKIVSLPDKCFENCKSLTDIKLSNNLDVIPKSCFEGCGSLKHIDLPEKLTIIKESAFEGSDLESVILPKKCKIIEKRAFYSSTGELSIVVPKNIDYIGDYAFGANSIIYCYPGSFALSFARRNNLKVRNAIEYGI